MDVIDFFDNAYREHRRYWLHGNRDSQDPKDFPAPWNKLLRALSTRPAGYALDLGAGEGSDAIRLARLGYCVDAVEGSAVGAEKIETFARQAGVSVNVINSRVEDFVPLESYEVVICNGLLHYVDDGVKADVLSTIQECTAPGGYNLVFAFSDRDPVPSCHRIVDVYCDAEDGIVASTYRRWRHQVVTERGKLDKSHVDFPPHRHSFIKLLAQKPG